MLNGLESEYLRFSGAKQIAYRCRCLYYHLWLDGSQHVNQYSGSVLHAERKWTHIWKSSHQDSTARCTMMQLFLPYVSLTLLTVIVASVFFKYLKCRSHGHGQFPRIHCRIILSIQFFQVQCIYVLFLTLCIDFKNKLDSDLNEQILRLSSL